MDKKPKVGVGIIVIKDNKVLLGKRKNSHGEGSWCFPGGHLEFNESLENCAKREVLEETGIEIKNIIKIHRKLLPASKDAGLMEFSFDNGFLGCQKCSSSY